MLGRRDNKARANRRRGKKRKAAMEDFRWGRAAWVLGILGLLFVAVIGRAIQIHVLDRERYLRTFRRNVDGSMVVYTKRASITDRRGEALALSLEARALVANPHMVKDPAAAASILAPVLGIDPERLVRILSVNHRFTFVAHQLSTETAERVRALMHDPRTAKALAGLQLDPDFKRVYPKAELAGQILGCVRVDHRGYAGLEYGLDRVFAAPMQGETLRLDAVRTGIRLGHGTSRLALLDTVRPLLEAGPPQIRMTLDARVQAKVETIIAEVVAQSFARRGLAIIYEVRTGDIVAFVHVPRANPNFWSEQSKEDREAWGVTEVYEPGSVMKVFPIAKAIDLGVVTPETLFDTHWGSLRVGPKTIRDLKKMKEATVEDILRYSSNIGAALVAREIGQDELKTILRAARFGKRTGLPLPGEAAGIAHLGDTRWDEVSFANIAFGQGIAVTALQFIRAFAAFGNDGQVLKPHIIGEVRGAGGEILYQARPTVVSRIVRPETARTMLHLLGRVVTPGATGARAALQDCPVGGKTGTGQQPVRDPETEKLRYTDEAEVASFAGFLPLDRPRFAIYVAIDRPVGGLGGGGLAAPAFARIAESLLDTYGMRPCSGRAMAHTRFRNQAPPARRAGSRPLVSDAQPLHTPTAGTVGVPDLRGRTIAEVIELLARRGLRPRILGAGLVTSQQPLPDLPVPEGSVVEVRCTLDAPAVHATH